MKRLYVLLFANLFCFAAARSQGIALGLGHRSPDSLRTSYAAVGLLCHADSLRGVQLGVMSNIAESMRGVQLGALSNIATSPFGGLQLSGISNIAMGVERGVQLSGVLNVSSGHMRGYQMGTYNYADSLSGSQLGLVNVARSHPKGWQVGIVNYTRDTVAHKIGLVNINPLTQIDLMVYGGTSSKLNTALRFRNRSTYNIIGIGSHYMGLDKKFSGALQYRIGQYFRLMPSGRWSLSGDVGFAHIETFEQHSQRSPERLFSVEARMNLDYSITDRLGAFVTLGYGDTRYYHHAHHYRSRPMVELGLTVKTNRFAATGSAFPRGRGEEGAASHLSSDDSPALGGGAWSGALQVFAINALVHGFDRFILAEDFAKTTMHTWRRNLTNNFVWDNDQFSTNLFAHPYHGNLYFNAARSSGLSFWQSAPYALGGSLMWELFGEVEPPAVNDLVATTVGGICIGETLHRVSDLVLRSDAYGFERFWREALCTVIDPMKGLSRIISGRAWRLDRSRFSTGLQLPAVDFSMSVGLRYLADDGALFRGEHNPYVNLYLEYGEPLMRGEHNRPYDFFDAEVTFGLSSNQPIISYLSVLGRLWSTPMLQGRRMNAEVGFYQHFNYYDSQPVKDGTSLVPYRISEAASLGPGIIFQFPEVGSITKLEQRLFLSGILLGGTRSDYYNVIDRDYNMGSGLSLKSKTHIELRHFGRFILHAKYFWLFTWKGYEQKDLSTVNPLYLNAQGDRGRAMLLVLNPMTEFDVGSRLSLVLSGSYFGRNTHYRYYPDVRARTFDVRAGLTWHL